MRIEWLPASNRFDIDDWTRAWLRKVYPFFDNEILKIEIWVVANWTNTNGKKGRGQKKDWARFVVKWLNAVKQEQKPTIIKDYKREDELFREKMEQAINEAAPPPDSWRDMINRLKPK